MAGRTPAQAVNNFLEPIHKALSCVTKSVISVAGGYFPSQSHHAATVNRGLPISLVGGLSLTVTIQYSLVKARRPLGPWKVKTEGYIYELSDTSGRIFGYHWHPIGRGYVETPHLHVRRVSAHLPTGRISLEEVLRVAIRELGAGVLRPDWENVLAKTQQLFEKYRTWH